MQLVEHREDYLVDVKVHQACGNAANLTSGTDKPTVNNRQRRVTILPLGHSPV